MIDRVEKAELIQRGYDAIDRGDVAAGAELLAPDATWHSALGRLMGKTVYVGFDEIARLVVEEIPSVLEDFRPEVLEIRDLGGELALAVVRWRATLRASGLEVDQIFGQLCRVRGDKWLELRSYESVDAAMAALPEVRARHAYDDWNRGDLDAAVANAHPEVILEQDPGIPGAETIRGRASLREWLGRFGEPWDEFVLEPERFVTAGDRTVAVLRVRAVARGGGPAVETRVAHLLAFRDGLVHRWQTYTDPQRALAEAQQ